MNGLPTERIAVIAGAPGVVIQDLLAALAERRSSVMRIAGVVGESHGLADRRCSAGYLRRISNGQRFPMFEDLGGAGSTTCHLEENGVARAAQAVRQDLAAGCDLVLLSKFGKLEAAGKGLWSAFVQAVEARLPLLTSVSPAVAPAWETLAGTGFLTLPPDEAAMDAWVDAVRARAPAS